MPFNIALFASGSGSNVENIVRYFSDKPDFHFPIIVSNKADAFVHQRAKALHIPSFTCSKEDFSDGHVIVSLLKEYQVDFVVLAGFLLKVSPTIIDAFPNKIINIHPALLPKFGGKGMYGQHVHHAVIESGETQSGITIHYVNAHYDAGNIIFQAVCDVLPEDTPDILAEKIHALEYEHFPLIIERLASTLFTQAD